MSPAVMIRILMIPTLAAASWLVGAPGALAQPQAEPMILEARIGLNGIFKLGCWTPLEVELLGGTKAYTGRVEATVPDSDGVPTTVFSPRPVGIEPGQSTTARLFLRVGQAQSKLRVRFRADGKVRSARTFYAGPVDNPGTVSGGTPATDLVMLVFGPALGLGELVQAPGGEEPTSRVTRIERAAELPTQWYGYEGIDVVLLTTSAPELYRPLLQNPLRREALHKWVVQGGRLVLFCGANGEELLSQGGPLAALLPGKYVETIKLRQSQPWELFCGAEAPITPDRRLNILAPRLEEVRGQILMNAGTKSADLPLVIRSQMGLGEVVFIGADFDRPPFKDWSARTSFLKKVLDWREDELQTSSEPGYGVEYVTDLTAQFRDALESKFIGVEVVPFGVVALLVGVYILLIGPGDYFLVHKVFRRAELTWLTFPLIVVAISVVAYWLANWMKGDQMRVNQVEIVDVDTLSGQVRGTAWTHFFTPEVHQYNLTFQPKSLASTDSPETQTLTSWLGMPGYRLGGMQTRGVQTSVFDSGYAYNADLSSMRKVPVQLWSTKTITARWSSTSDMTLESDLEHRAEELVGSFANTSEVGFEDCHLLYGGQAYALGKVAPGARAVIDGSNLPRRVKTMLTNATAGEVTETKVAEDGTVPFARANMDVARLAKIIMFYRAIDGFRYTNMAHRYQAFLDLSHLLAQDDLAILLCRISTTGSRWFDNDEPLGSNQDRHWTYYRFVLPVESQESRVEN